uniref:L-serine deaminase n=1 Tax=Erpetoichthys calabaricus TaxID=27687 RepID=A0A8C4TC93_ERPCA
MSSPSQPFHLVSPLLESLSLTKIVGAPVFLKMDNTQPSGSFKIRGIGHYCQQAATHDCQGFVCSSGGNAGLATAYVARKLNIPATVIVPSSTPDLTVQKLREYGASVQVFGQVWDDADREAHRLAESQGLKYVPPFDHPLIWQGHSTVVKELRDHLPTKPGAIVVAVGGGGLLCGVAEGVKEVGWEDVPIIAMETIGADSLNAAVKAGKLVTLPDITSEAKCLGAKTVCPRALEVTQQLPILSHVVTDQQALQAIKSFLDDERVLVELSCGAALGAIYSGLITRLQTQGQLPAQLCPLVVIVCGGSGINLDQLLKYQEKIMKG